MPEIPPEDVIKATIQPGSVYYFRHESFQHSDLKHYFIVINLDPINEQVILLVSSTTRPYCVNQRRRNYPPETIVEVTPGQYPDFNLVSIIDCNSVYKISIQKLIAKYSLNELDMKTKMAIPLVEQFRKGVLASPTVSKRIKAQLTINSK